MTLLMTEKELLTSPDYSEKFSSILNPNWPAETFDAYDYNLFLTLAEPEELEGNYCSLNTLKKIEQFKNAPVARDDSFVDDDGQLVECIKYFINSK